MTKPIAIIPARGGSKRIPRKNIKAFAGLPLIAHSIKTLQESAVFEKIVVSTDDDEIASLSLEYGADEILHRDAALSNDTATTLAVIADAVTQLGLTDDIPVCCCYATAPLMQSSDIQQAFLILTEHPDARYVFSACEYDFPVQRGFVLSPAIEMLFPEHQQTRSQDLPHVFHDAGQFYWARAATWRQQRPIFEKNSIAYELHRKYVQDIDTMDDWEIAELKFKLLGMRQTAQQ